MDKGKSFILIIVIVVVVIFLLGVFYILGSFVFKGNSSVTVEDPRVRIKKLESENIVFEKTEITSDIDYDFKIES